jgi:hypothetical protein
MEKFFMPRISRILFILSVLFISATAATAQAAISEEKHNLIAEMVSILKMDKQMSAMVDSALKEMETTYPTTVNALIDSRNDLTSAEKAKMKASMETSNRSFGGKFRQRMAEFDFEKYINETIYPLYDKFYSEQELRDIIIFYRSATGQKVIETLPQVFAESQIAAREKLLPQMISIIQEILQEELAKVAPPSRAVKKRNN